MNPIPAEITDLEARLKLARVPLARMFRKAEIDRSTWSRWRGGKGGPTEKKWRAVLAAVETLTDPAATVDKGGHGAAVGA